ncbi:MAG: hypothetical protein LW817_08760, partial [Candidatus Caenarcaniphilales bacterium]|nr:hypothetical protein [Candidatus Caenarcaniphilales bacterium]
MIIITAIPSGTRAAIDPQRTRVVQRYKPLAWVSGVDSGLRLYIHEKSLNLDLAKTNEIRLRVKVSPLFNSKDQISSFKIILKDAETGDFITSQNLTISRSHRGSRVISFNAGFFKSATKTLDIELYDTANYLLNTYTTTLSAANVTSQITGGVSEIGPEANCTSTNFGECQVDYFLQKVTFEARPQRQISTRVYKSENGFYKVSVAVPKKPFDELGLRFKRKGRSRPSSGGGASTTSFGETLDISQINIGSSNSDAVNITNNSGNIVFSGATNRTGKLGIGVNNPQAWLHITGSLNGTPSIILNPGVLSSTTPPNGSIEFDGNKLYFTKNGIRNELGAQGPHGSPGAPGGPGPQGPAGPAGPAGTGSNGTANNMVINNGYLQDPTFNGSILFTDNSVTRFNGRTLFQEGPAPVTVANYGQIFVNGTTSNLMFLDDTGNQYDLLSFANPLTLNGFTSDNFLRSNTSDQYTSGTLTTLTGTTFRVNGDLAIADTNIALTGASTTFTQSTGNIIMNPTGVVDINATTIVDGFRMATGASNTFIMTSNAGGQGSWTNPNSITVGNATNALNAVNSNNLDNLDSTRFLRSDTSDQFTTGSLATLTGTTFRVNGDLDIADTNIILSGASTSFTGTGFLGFSPGAGTNMNINLSGTGDFAVNTNQLYVDTSATNTGFGMTTPNEKITVEGRTSYRETTRPALTANYGKIYVNGTTSNLMFLDDAGAQYDLL